MNFIQICEFLPSFFALVEPVKHLLKKRPFAARGACAMEVPMRDRSLRRVRVRGISASVNVDDCCDISGAEGREGEGEAASSAADHGDETDAILRGSIAAVHSRLRVPIIY